MTVKKELQALLFQQQQEEYSHISIEEEFAFYRDIARGNLAVLQGNIAEEPWEHMGVLSGDALQNHKYHLVILISMVTRFCIEEGLEPEQAYTLSDLFIRKVDACSRHDSLDHLKVELVTEYTRTMHALKNGENLSYHVRHAIDYIVQHISTPLSSGDVADAIGLHRDYLSRLFHAETGYTLGRYILHKKCETSCYMLRNSSISCTDISSFLGFSSCSHYIRCFRREYGVTPARYRKTHELH